MKFRLLCSILLVTTGFAQEIHQRETFGALKSAQAVSDTLPAPKYLQERVVNGKLRLSLQDAIVATLMNNSQVRLQELNVEDSKFSLLRAHSPFDPSALVAECETLHVPMHGLFESLISNELRNEVFMREPQ